MMGPLVCRETVKYTCCRQESRCAYVVLIMAVYWISEAVPIAATAFLPVILMPFLGILSAKVVTKAYIKVSSLSLYQTQRSL